VRRNGEGELPRIELARMAAAFLSGGVRTVLIALRGRDEVGSSLVVGYFYEALAQGNPAARSWTAARARLGREHPGERERTLLFGDGDLRLIGIAPPDLRVLEATPEGRPWWLYLLAAFAIPALVFLGLRRLHGE
jgi:hypothetical protein